MTTVYCVENHASAPVCRQQGLPLRHPIRPRRAGLSPSSAPGGWGPRLRVTRCRHLFDGATTAYLLAAVLAAGTLVGCRSASVAAVEPAPRPEAAFVAGELIVKLSPESGRRLDEALAAGRPLDHTDLAWFDALSQRYGVTKIEPAFTHRADIEDIKRKFPERTKRAPPGAAIPSLQHAYTLTMSRDADVLQAASDYAAHPDVEYAEPNYLATIQQGTAPPP